MRSTLAQPAATTAIVQPDFGDKITQAARALTGLDDLASRIHQRLHRQEQGP